MRISAKLRSAPPHAVPWVPVVTWTAAVVILSAVVWLRPHAGTVYMYYCDAGRAWVNGTSCYLLNGQISSVGYRYSPTASVLFTLFGALPDDIGGILWRWLGAALVVAGFGYACRTIYPHWAETTPTERQWLWLLVLPLAVANLHNGQANLHMLGLLLIGVSAVHSGRWNLATVCFAAAVFVKIYPIALVMLLIALFPWRLGPRFAIAIGFGLALPFFAQSTGYVVEEYRTWFRCMEADDRFIPGARTLYKDLALLLQIAHVPITRSQYLLVEAGTGAAAALTCLYAQWRLRWSAERLTALAYALGTFWMLLCGPTTESSTYILIAPLAAWLVLDAIRGRMSMPCRVLVIAGSVLVHVTLLSSAFPFGRAVHDLGLQPLGAFVMLIGYLVDRFGASAAVPAVAWGASR